MLLNKMSDIFKPDELAAAAESLRGNMTPTELNVHYIGNRRDGKQKNGNNRKDNHRPRGKGSKQNGANKKDDSGNGKYDPQVNSAAAAPEDNELDGPITLACINHAAPVYKSLPSLVPDPFITSATFTHDICCFDTDIEIDSGSFATILARKIVPQTMLKKLKPSLLTISGLNGKARSTLGYLEMSLSFGSGPQLDARVFVMEDCPSLLGQDVLRSRDIRSCELGRNYLRLNFDGKYKSLQPQKIQLKQNMRVGVANSEGENKVNKVPKDCPILWVKQNLGIDLPAHAPLDHRRLVAQDLKDFKAAFATSCSSLGEFPEPAELPTIPGEVRNRKQIPIP